MSPVILFHRPSFWEKIHDILSAVQVQALLAAMMAYAARFYQNDNNSGINGITDMHHHPGYFLDLALQFVDDALRECGQETPPLCILQALIITEYCQLTGGVRGKAWRSLGICIRLAYELNLHVVDAVSSGDATKVDKVRWGIDEEKRRAWWAIWEMDIFASTIRRCPTGINQMHIETLLPVEDEDWFQNRPQQSCFLERDVVYTWKSLQKCGNESPKAWYIVINSLMQEARHLSSPRGVRSSSASYATHSPLINRKSQDGTGDIATETRQKLATLLNSVHCFVLALPSRLQYRGQYLDFATQNSVETLSTRQLHSSIYSIYMMTQLASLMVHHYDAFGGPDRARCTAHGSNSRNAAETAGTIDSMALSKYFEAADNILTIVQRSAPEHVQHINPCLSSTIWLASATQLVRKQFMPPGSNHDLVKSKFEVLHMTYKKAVEFWDIQTALQKNLETLEAQLDGLRLSGYNKPDPPTKLAKTTVRNPGQKVPSAIVSWAEDDNRIVDVNRIAANMVYPINGESYILLLCPLNHRTS